MNQKYILKLNMKEDKLRIAVVSPNITNLGGVSRCAVVLIGSLNKKGIVPDYFGVYSNKDKIRKLFNRNINYNFKKVYWFKKAILYSAWIKNIQLLFKKYDYIFDFTNTLPLNKNRGNYFSYILYPEFLTSRGKYNKGIWKFYYLPHRLVAYCQRHQFKNPKIDMACVSRKTSGIIKKTFGTNLPTLYPPTNLSDFKNKIRKKKGVISVGGLTHEKNQLEQMSIARKFPKVKFSICGNSKRNPIYFRELKNQIDFFGNVKFYPDLPFNKLKDKLIHSEVFLNSGREDPFCMALIEGISAGCIPLIHNSGGIVEVVPFKELRYNNKKEAIIKLKRILNLSKKEKDKLRKKLQKYIKQFGEKQFTDKLFNFMENRNI